MSCQVLWIAAMKDPAGNSLERGELGGVQILGDVDGAGVDKLLKAKAWGGFSGAIWRDRVWTLDGSLPRWLSSECALHGLRSCTYWTLEGTGKVSFASS